MWREATVSRADLENLEDLEKRLGGRIVDAREGEDGRVIVRYAPVVNDSWFVEVWGNQATLCIIDQFGFVNFLEDAFAEWDDEALQRVIDQVMRDYGITLSDTGQYYPISDEAEAAFQEFLQRARRKPRVR